MAISVYLRKSVVENNTVDQIAVAKAWVKANPKDELGHYLNSFLLFPSAQG
ncbi:hypothetical protein [Candidatus Paracaedibacter symbiosus]|uniref:hypothetical protein n=1 Tax=Candidatus Paracaedibacter symbiosus TaxID=244582 RepID=UPI0018DD4DEC|nr:hypothetical protein [Candidatus Paracaedibacter symbiosus]